MTLVQPGLAHARGATATPLIEQTIPAFFDAMVARQPDHPALVSRHQQRRYSYRELQRASRRLASALLDLGLAKGDRIGIWSHNNAEWVLMQLATAQVGLVLVNINPAYRTAELEYALNKVGCKALVTMPRFKTSDYLGMLRELGPAKLPALRHTVWIDVPGEGAEEHLGVGRPHLGSGHRDHAPDGGGHQGGPRGDGGDEEDEEHEGDGEVEGQRVRDGAADGDAEHRADLPVAPEQQRGAQVEGQAALHGRFGRAAGGGGGRLVGPAGDAHRVGLVGEDVGHEQAPAQGQVATPSWAGAQGPVRRSAPRALGDPVHRRRGTAVSMASATRLAAFEEGSGPR